MITLDDHDQVDKSELRVHSWDEDHNILSDDAILLQHISKKY